MTTRSFIDAFQNAGGSCRAMCECGKQFYAPDGQWDWFEGELEELAKTAEIVEGHVSLIEFEGSAYVLECNCWHERAKRIMAFIDGHAEAIAKYLTLEKKRKQFEADQAPVVDP